MPQRQEAIFRCILVPIDFGEPSRKALELAVGLAKTYGSSLTILHTFEFPAYASVGSLEVGADLLSPVRDAAKDELDRELSDLRRQLPSAQGVLVMGVADEEILGAIREYRADLVVMGTHGRRGLSHALLGSVAEKVVRMSPVPVLTVRGS